MEKQRLERTPNIIPFFNWVFSRRLGLFTPHRWAEDGLTESGDWKCNIDTKTWKTRLSCCESVIFLISIISSVKINFESRNLITYFSRKDTFHPLLSVYWLVYAQKPENQLNISYLPNLIVCKMWKYWIIIVFVRKKCLMLYKCSPEQAEINVYP